MDVCKLFDIPPRNSDALSAGAVVRGGGIESFSAYPVLPQHHAALFTVASDARFSQRISGNDTGRFAINTALAHLGRVGADSFIYRGISGQYSHGVPSGFISGVFGLGFMATATVTVFAYYVGLLVYASVKLAENRCRVKLTSYPTLRIFPQRSFFRECDHHEENVR